jgi:hypothetical protein
VNEHPSSETGSDASSAPSASWPDAVRDIIGGDLTAACALTTRFGGISLFPVCPFGMFDDDAPVGTVTLTSPAALCAKLPGMVERPQVALAFFCREHGLGSSPGFVLVQGEADVQPEGSDALRAEAVARWPQYLGPIPTGRIQDRVQRAYVHSRVPITIRARRICWWQDPHASGDPDVVVGPARPPAPAPQQPPTAPGRPPKTAKVDRQLTRGPHRLLGWIDAEGFPTVAPVPGAAVSGAGIALGRDDLPPGGRRATLLSFWYRERLQGQGLLHTRGWLDPDAGGHLHPTTAEMFNVPASALSPKLIVPLAVAAQHARAQRRGLVDGPRWLGAPPTRTGGSKSS